MEIDGCGITSTLIVEPDGFRTDFAGSSSDLRKGRLEYYATVGATNPAEKRAPEILASDRESASRLTPDGNWWHPEDIVVEGAAAGFGRGAFITNAHNVRELNDEFDT